MSNKNKTALTDAMYLLMKLQKIDICLPVGYCEGAESLPVRKGQKRFGNLHPESWRIEFHFK